MKETNRIFKAIAKFKIEFFFAANSISMTFTAKDKDFPHCRLWIDPPWRFIKNNHIVLSSSTCPWHEDFDSNEEYKKAFEDWCNKVNYLKESEIIKITIAKGVNDLIIHWKEDSKVEIFQDKENEEAWYLEDKDNGVYHIAFPHTIIQETTKAQYRTDHKPGSNPL